MLFIITCIIMTVNNNAYNVVMFDLLLYCYIMFCVNKIEKSCFFFVFFLFLFFFLGGDVMFKHTLVNKKKVYKQSYP